MNTFLSFILLPAEISDFEREYVRRWNRIALAFFSSHLLIFPAIAWVNGTGPLSAFLLTALVLAGPAAAGATLRNPRAISTVMGVASMAMGGLLVHFGHGPIQIEMHFYFFVLIALLAVFANPVVILAAAGTVAAHHALLWLLAPASVFNYDAPFWVVGVHALFVVLESVAACVIARSYFDSVVGLERTVQARTQALDRRNADVRLMLDNTGQGFLTVGPDGTIGEERSTVVDRWFGDVAANTPFDEVLSRLAPVTGETFALGWDMIREDILPMEVAIAQLPAEIQAGNTCWSIDYRPVLSSEGVFERMLVVVSDVTAERVQARAEAEQGEFVAAFERLMRDPAGFLEFWTESDRMLAELRTEADLGVVKRLVHTLKGNAGMFGLTTLATACHEIEDVMVELGDVPTAFQLQPLFETWNRMRERLRTVIESSQRPDVYVDDGEFEAILADIATGAPRERLVARIRAWKMEPARLRLDRLAAQVRFTAARLGKGAIEVCVDVDGARMDQDAWAPVWNSLTHVVRNAIDHGVEGAEERMAAGKSENGALTLRVYSSGAAIYVEVSDDGRGVDWERIAERAAAAGLVVDSHEAAVAAMCADGLSTRDEVTEVSGRGIGMGAVASAAATLGGRIEVISERGQGTLVRIVVPDNGTWGDTSIRRAAA